jgi:trans-aconitate methyltransferase
MGVVIKSLLPSEVYGPARFGSVTFVTPGGKIEQVTAKPNPWDTELYEGRFSFVWNMGAGLIDLLAPEPGERILDLGCGTGHLSGQIAGRGAEVIGIDGDPAMVAQARINYPKLTFMLADARRFTLPQPVDAVFSNAVLHWMREPEQPIRQIREALLPGGRFVAELGGKGNTDTLLQAVRAETGVSETPWYFPSLGEYSTLLEQHGFSVTHAFHFHRDTPLEGERGIEEWLDMFGQQLLAPVPREERPAVKRRIADRARPALYRDGRWQLDYKRLRIRAVRES